MAQVEEEEIAHLLGARAVLRAAEGGADEPASRVLRAFLKLGELLRGEGGEMW